jgi:hypothetical protein
MNIVNIALFVIIAYILYIITVSKKNVSFTTTVPTYNSQKYNSKSYKDDIMDDIVSIDESYGSMPSGIIQKRTMNSNFLNIQFHNDYRDVITGLNNLVPDKKQLFNLANIPIKYSEPDSSEVRYMVDDFLKILNINIKTEVPAHRSCNSGWDEAIPDPTMKKTGWEKVQESIGLPTSLYEKPAPRSKVVLVAINMVQKYETEDEVKYVCQLVLQKLNTEDQIIIKASFVQDKRPLNDENMFFKKDPIQLKVTIENIFIIGYLSNYGPDHKLQFDGDEYKYMDYNKLEYNQLTDPKEVNKILMTKYRQRTQEMEQRNAMLDEEGQEFHRTLPTLFDYSQYLNHASTRTLFPKNQ